MEQQVRRYYALKQQHKQVEQELAQLRLAILDYCQVQGVSECEVGPYHIKVISQQRKEFDDRRLYNALPDPELWRMLSRADPAKIASLIKLRVLTEDAIAGTYTTKDVPLLQVDKP